MKKKLVRIDEVRLNQQVRELEALIPQIELLIQQAKSVLGSTPETLTGEKEVNQLLTLSDYPNATTITASELMGVAPQYKDYISNLKGLGSLEDYELNDEGKVSVKASKLDSLKEDNSLYLSGAKLKAFEGLQRVCAELDKVNKDLPNPIAHRLIQVDYNGKPTPNIAQILHGRWNALIVRSIPLISLALMIT